MTDVLGSPIVVDGEKTVVGAVSPGGPLEVVIDAVGTAGCEGRLGRWVFTSVPPGPVEVEVSWCGTFACSLAALSSEQVVLAPASSGPVPGAFVHPRMVLSLRWGTACTEVPLKVSDTKLLGPYYRFHRHQERYSDGHPFTESFHRHRLRCLRRLFRKHIRSGSRVLDVGSGYSVFSMIGDDRNLRLSCCDIDSSTVERMRESSPGWDWVVADARDLPWDDGYFDAVHAGEIIEHVPDPLAALGEWGRVLSPGGILILSTPNRDRLLARANRAVMPVNEEHMRELNLAELRTLTGRAGFEVLKVIGIYLELLINWWKPPGSRVDLLTARFADARYLFAYSAAMGLGRITPSLAYDIVAVCRKKT